MEFKNTMFVAVAKDTARQATTILDPSSGTYIADGEVVVADLAGNLLTSTASSYTGKEKVVIVMRKGDKIVTSQPISYKNIVRYGVKPYAAATQQVSYLGYDGVDATKDLEVSGVIASNDYIVTMRLQKVKGADYDSFYNNKSVMFQTSSGTPTSSELADGLVEQLVLNFNKDHQIDNYFIAERVHDGAATVLGGASTLRVINGSKLAIASAGGHGLVAGDYVRIGGTALTTPVYKVESVNSTSIYLDVPYQNDSGTVSNNHVLEIDDPTTGVWGIKFTANTKTLNLNSNFFYDLFKFKITLTNFESTEITSSVDPFKGVGTYGEVAEMELKSYGLEGVTVPRFDIPPRVHTLYATSGKTYDYIVINTYDDSTHYLGARSQSPYQIYIAMPVNCTQGDSTAGGGVALGVASALDLWLNTNTGSSYNEDAKLT